MEPRRVLTSVKGVSPKLLANMEQRLAQGAGKKKKDIFRDFLQDVIRKANPRQEQQPKKPTIKELPERVIIRKTVGQYRPRHHDDDIVPFDLDEL